MSFGIPSAEGNVNNPSALASRERKISERKRALPSGTNLLRNLGKAGKQIITAPSTPISAKEQQQSVANLDIRSPDTIRVSSDKGSLPTMPAPAAPAVPGSQTASSSEAITPKAAVGAGTEAPRKRRRTSTILTSARGITTPASPRYSIIGGSR
tara:strand:- start:18816 stop:19277 length:462 start_codon:yes stop_codon:yes gene_type:complete